MKKIILALDGLRLSESAIDYAAYISKEFNAHIVATFLEEAAYFSQPVGHDIWWPYYSASEAKKVLDISRKDDAARTASIKKLQELFEEKGVPHTIHKDHYLALHALLLESNFADMVIIDADASFSNFGKTRPSHFIRNLLSEAGCPILLVPKKFKPIERFVFAYDGSPSAAFAIRQFTYLFPENVKQQVEIVTVTGEKNTTHIPHHNLLKELLKRKYDSVLLSVLKPKQEENALLEHLKTENRNCLVVLGAYKRSALSMWMHHSTADLLIRELKAPLFIAHH